MPFDKKISTKHITSKCHFTPLTLSGTRVKQWSKASRRIQVTVGRMDGRRLPAEGTAPKCLCLSALAVCNKYHAFLKTYWSKNEFSEYDFSSFSSCWMLSDVQGTPLSVLCSIFIDVQNSLSTIQKWSLHSKTFSSFIYRRLLFSLSFSLFLVQKRGFETQPTLLAHVSQLCFMLPRDICLYLGPPAIYKLHYFLHLQFA